MKRSKKDSPKRDLPRNIPVVPSLFEMGTEMPPPVEAKQEIENPAQESQRIVNRLAIIVEDHKRAAEQLNIKLGPNDLALVIDSLKNHAKGGKGTPVSGARDEIHGYCLNRLFDELVEEPSNILFMTQKGADTVRYDAMNANFWLECLDLFELTYCKP